jgi:head-tail adaptor
MRAGELRHKVIFRTPVRTSDGQGGAAVTYPTATVTTRCAARPITGDETLRAGNLITSTQIVRLTIRARDISTTQRVDVTYGDSGQTVSYQIQRIERGDDKGNVLYVYVTAVETAVTA